MDELAESLAVSFSVSSDPNSTAAQHPRYSEYKRKTSKSDQENRRKDILQLQKEQRFDYANLARRILDDDWNDAEDLVEEDAEDMDCAEPTKRSYKPGRYYRNQLMLSEWLVEVPEDFEENWLMVLCPWGKRCLIVSAKGETTAYGRNGYRMKSFPSQLPGGHRRQSGRYKENAILDCIFHEVEKTFYVLDIMNWKDHPVYDSETEFRVFWMQSKMQECPELGESSKLNPYKFVPLPFHPCHRETLKSVFDSTQDQFDGCLFYHKRAHYVFGSSPLVVWLKPYMVQEMIGIETPEHMQAQKPANYSTYASHMDDVAERKKKFAAEKEKRKETRKNKRGPDRSKDFKMDLMTSKWLTSLPDDFSTNWSVLACPLGQRCLVMAIDGETKWFNKTGHKLPGYFLSVLPGGNGTEYGYGPTVVTLLDCIFEEESGMFFVLDCMLWGSQDLKQLTYTERMSYLKKEVMRKPEVKCITEINMYPIIPLYVYGTSVEELDELIRKSKFEIDGLLFFEEGSQYEPGQSDHVLWTKPYMLPDLFENIAVPPSYMKQKPDQYTDFETFTDDLSSGKWKDKKRKKKKPFQPTVDLQLPPQPEQPKEKQKNKKKEKKHSQYSYYGPEEGFRGRGLTMGQGWNQGRGRGFHRDQHSGDCSAPVPRGAGNRYRGNRPGGMVQGSYGKMLSEAGGDNYNGYYGLGRGHRGVYGRGVATGYQYYGDDRDMYYPPMGRPQSAGSRKIRGAGYKDPFCLEDMHMSLPSYYDYNMGRKQQYPSGRKPYKLF